MTTLFINTCTSKVSLALLKNDEIIGIHEKTYNKDMSKYLVNELDFLFSKSGLKPKDLNNIVCAVGPGSFTGIRMGITVAKTLAYAFDILIYPISSLQVMASGKDLISIPLIDARRGYVYGAVVDHKLNYLIDEVYITREHLINYANKFHAHIVEEDNFEVDFKKVIQKAFSYNPISAHNLKPKYLKETQAERELNERNKINRPID